MALHHRFTHVALSGTAFYGDLRIDFLDGLNTPIGGCGAGKTGVLECLPFALGIAPAPGHEEQSAKHLKKILGGGRVEVGFVTMHGVPYVASRSIGEPPRVRDARGELVGIDLAELFSVEVYNVSEILEIAGDPARQLPLIDKFEPATIRALDQRTAEVERRLVVNAAHVAKLDEELAENATREAELPSVAAALAAMTLAGADAAHAARTKGAQERKMARGRERRAVAEMPKELAAARAAFEAVARDTLHRLARSVEGDLERGACGEAFARAHAAVHRVAGAIEAAAAGVRAEVAAAHEAIATEARAVEQVHAREEDEYHALVVRQDEDRQRAAAREELHRRFEELSAVGRRMTDVRRERDARVTDERTMTLERAALIDERSSVRERIAQEATAAMKGVVEVTIRRGEDRAAFQEKLEEMLRGANIRPTEAIGRFARAVRPADLVEILRKGDVDALVSLDLHTGNKQARAEKIVATLRRHPRMHELQTVQLGDLPLLRLMTDAGAIEVGQGSTGQRSICVLNLILLLSVSPLLIDQVEEGLDNQYIYEVLVKVLRRMKKDRQMILVSHNACIPVLSDSDRVFVHEVVKGQGTIRAMGTVDEMRDWLEKILDGGREAFRRRGERYGHFPHANGGGALLDAPRVDHEAADAENGA